MQTVHSKQTMLSLLNGKMADDGYKRKKLKVSNSEVKENPPAVSTEMDIDDAEGTSHAYLHHSCIILNEYV